LITLAIRFQHPSFSSGDAGTHQRLAEILTRPCFVSLHRLSLMRRDRQTAYRPKSAEGIVEYLAAAEDDSIYLDSGRRGELVAASRIERSARWLPADSRSPAPMLSHVVVPLEMQVFPALKEALCELAIALRTVTGAATAAASFDEGHNFVLFGKVNLVRALTTGSLDERRLMERAAGAFYSEQVNERIGGPEWGLFLSDGHLQKLDRHALRATFADVRELSEFGLVYLQLTADPVDALRPNFLSTVGRARQTLAPVLMDLSGLPVHAWK